MGKTNGGEPPHLDHQGLLRKPSAAQSVTPLSHGVGFEPHGSRRHITTRHPVGRYALGVFEMAQKDRLEEPREASLGGPVG